MEGSLLLSLIGIPVIFFGGSLFHFLYKYGGKKWFLAIISPVNESIWEHLKIAFYPSMIYTLIKLALQEEVSSNFLSAEIVGVYTLMGVILVTELIYPPILKRNILILDLLLFIIGIIAGQITSYYIQTNSISLNLEPTLPVFIIVAQVGIFILFNYFPPKLNLFMDSTNGRYGIQKKVNPR